MLLYLGLAFYGVKWPLVLLRMRPGGAECEAGLLLGIKTQREGGALNWINNGVAILQLAVCQIWVRLLSALVDAES